MPWRRWHPDLWTLDHPLVAGGLHLGARATAIRGPEGVSLVSPVPLTDADAAALAELGPVTALVAPNLLHWMYAGAAQQRWPQASLHGPAGLKKKAPDLPWSAPPSGERWRGLVPVPLGGLPGMDETALYHPESRTLVTMDLAFNVVSSDSWWTRTFMRINDAYGKFGPSRIFRTMLKDPAALRLSLDHIQSLQPDRVVVAHGEVLETGGAETIRERFAWVGA